MTTLPPSDPDRPGERRIRPFLATPAGPEPADPLEQPTQRLRPFVLTSGRVPGGTRIGFETQVTAQPDQPTDDLAPPLRAILEACVEPVSVAEISARLRLHLGVAQVLVGDLHDAGHVDLHTTDDSEAHNPDTILRVIRGLRSIT